MARVWGLLLLGFAAGAFLQNSANLYESIARLIDLRHKLMAHPDDLRRVLCSSSPRGSSGLFWNEEGQWINACLSHKKTGTLPRIWRMTVTGNYRMLFLREVPITFAIVIKR